MNITFKLESETQVNIMNGDKTIGQIFTPAGTGHNITSAIQVCGFNDIVLFDYWGCGIFHDGKGHAKKDVGMFFSEDSTTVDNDKLADVLSGNSCHRCFYPKKDCKCEDLRVKRMQEVLVQELEEKGLM